MGMAKIGNWFRRQDIAYLGIQQRENSVYMIMVAEKEGEDYEIIWQNQITEDIAQEELLEFILIQKVFIIYIFFFVWACPSRMYIFMKNSFLSWRPRNWLRL